MRKSILLLAPVVLGMSAFAAAQGSWIPVTANLREIYTVEDKAGRVLSVETKIGNFYRNTEGSTLEYWTSVNGDTSLGGSGKLNDNLNVAEYSLNTKTRIAVKNPPESNPEPLKPDYLSGARSGKLGQEAVEGIVCYYTPVTLTEPNKPSRQIGKACQAADYGLTVKFEIQVVSPDGQIHKTSRELYNIRIGETPDPKLFQLAPDFQILKQE